MASAWFPAIWILGIVLQLVSAQSGDGYFGYSLTERGDPDSVVYETADTPSNASSSTLPPDVYLNASLSVGEIDVDVQNLTAQINLSASVLSLLKFNAGVDVSIDSVVLTIQNVTAKVLLEARLENLVRMIDDVLDSLDLNPTLATLGQDVGQIANDTSSAVSGSGTATARSVPRDIDLTYNILYAVNDYSGNTHTNRVLAQDGNIVAQSLHNDGNIYHQAVVGNYKTDMTFNGYNTTVTRGGQLVHEQEYVYTPFPGLFVVSAIFTDAAGKVVSTQVLSEARGGGSSTIEGELKS